MRNSNMRLQANMTAVTILITSAFVCLALPAGADVRALYTMTQSEGDLQMLASSRYINHLRVGPEGAGGAPNGDLCWDDDPECGNIRRYYDYYTEIGLDSD